MSESGRVSTIPITSLTPDTSPPPDRSIRAVVTLSWPYSSSTRQCALLLADPDFRLRNRKGQVRVRFTGPSAEAVANARIGIGDEIVLALDGASWEQDTEATRTPGKSVDGELLFKRRLQLNIVKAEAEVRVHVDAPVSPPLHSVNSEAEIATPLPRTVQPLRPTLDRTGELLPEFIYTSPSFRKRLRLSGEPDVDSTYDPFTGYTEDSERSHKQTWSSFGRSVKWRYAEKTPSPIEEAFDQDRANVEDEGSAADTAQTPKTQMSHPPLPSTQVSLEQHEDLITDTVARDVLPEGPFTPPLRTVESATLPLSAPFSAEQHHAQLRPIVAPPSDLDEIPDNRSSIGLLDFQMSVAQTQDFSKEQQVLQDLSLEHDRQSVDHVLITDVEDSRPLDVLDPEADRGQEKDTAFQPLYNAPPQTEASDEIFNASQTRLVGSETTGSIPQRPGTPVARATNENVFGFDGASFVSPLDRVTPQSEKEKIMTETYRSLFGFKRSPEAQSQPSQEHPQSPSPVPAPTRVSQNTLSVAENSSAGGLEAASVSSTALPSPVQLLTGVQADAQRLDPIQQTAPTYPSGIEVIELGSSSDEEDEADKERQSQPTLMASLPLPERAAPQLEGAEPLARVPEETSLSQKTPEMQETKSLYESHPSQAGGNSFDSLVVLSPERSLMSEVDELIPPSSVATAGDATRDASSAVVSEGILDEAQMNAKVRLVDIEAEIPNSQEQTITPQQATMETPLYPRLPLSPSNSQSIADMISLPAAEELVADVSANTLPPTPQLTQELSSTRLQDPEQRQPPVDEAYFDESSTHESGKHDELRMPSTKLSLARKSLSSRKSYVPDIISDWFSPKGSSHVTKKDFVHNELHDEHDALNLKSTEATAAPFYSHTQHVSGLSTSLSYFTPLSRLEQLLNPSSQQAHGTSVIDVFAIVADATSEAVKAKKGPRDYFTLFKIFDTSLQMPAKVRVEVYRPWHATLPVASVGDVILLRAFAVKSRDRSPYLLSTDASAWCVWRYSEKHGELEDESKPIWARKRGGSREEIREEVKGPPLEFGEEERAHAMRLHDWWRTLPEGRDEGREETAAVLIAPSAQPVAAKL